MKNMPKKTAISLVVATMSATTLVNHSVEANAVTDQQVTSLSETGTDNSISKGYLNLSDLNYVSNMSSVGYSEIKKDTNIDGGKITLIVEEGETIQFDKGLGAHATSTVVYDVSQYSNQYTRFMTYAGVDKSQGSSGDGVKFTISTSMDGQNWTEVEKTDVLKGNQQSAFIDVDITGVKYLKLHAHENSYNGNDHAVYGAPKIMTADYDPSTDVIGGVKSVAQYDKEIKAKYSQNQEMTEELKLLLLQRTFTKRLGYYTLQDCIKQGDDYRAALNYILNDKHILEYYLMAVEPQWRGSYSKALTIFTNLYKEHKADFLDATHGDLYLKMAIATAFGHAGAESVKFWTGNNEVVDPYERYDIYKANYENGRMAQGIQNGNLKLFEDLPVFLMRWVMDSYIDNDQIDWLIDYSLTKKAQGADFLDAYTYIEYDYGFDYNYDNEQYYTQENYDKWNAKYNISRLKDYGKRGVHKLWMVFEEGSVCGGLAKTYANLSQVFGMPAQTVGQPAHAATITYRLNDEGKGVWYLQNDNEGWKGTYKGDFPLGWGNPQSWMTRPNDAGSYIFLGQHALNNYDTYLEANYYNYLANIYESDPQKQIEIYNKALDIQNYNLDSYYGLIHAYKKLDTITGADYIELANRVAEGLTFFPLPLVDTLNLIKLQLTDDLDKARLDLLQKRTLERATQATNADATQPNECVTMAKFLLGHNKFELATFSFDGENSGKIVFDESYANSSIRWEYSLDNWKTKVQTDAKEITLTAEEIAKINVTDDIQISLVGTSDIYTIDITQQQTPSNLYVNDLENQFRGVNQPLEYSEDGGTTWVDYDEENTRFTSDKTLKVRYKASGTKKQSEVSEYKFTADNQPDTRKYIPLKHVSLYRYSSQQNEGNNAAKNFIDGYPATVWHNNWGGEELKYFSVELDELRYLSAVEYQTEGGNGAARDLDIYTSVDGQTWEKVGQARGLHNNNVLKVIELDKVIPAKYVMLHAVSTHGHPNDAFFTGRLLNLFEDTTKETAPEVTVTYNTEELTNQDVIATINLPEGYEVIGDATHTFTQNGTHTFTYQSPTGKEFTHEVTVNWIDKVAPTATISYSTTNKTNQSVTATLNIQEENITVENNKTSHVFDSNGEYTFTIRDQAGNRAEVKAEVTWINKEKPVLDVTYSTEEETDQPVTATLITEDVQVKSINGKVITVTNNNGNKEYIFTDNGEFTFEYVDDYGNTGTTTAKVDWIVKIPDVEATDIKVTYSEPQLTNQDVTATIELPEGYTLIGDATHTFTQNGTHTFTYQSVHGTQYTHTITVDWIDKVAPTATITYSNENKTNQNVIATLNVSEENITIENNNGEAAYEFTQNGEFTFIIRDQAGNRAEVKAVVTWINKETPVLDVTYSTEEETDQPVVATLVTENVQIKDINGKVITVTNNNGSTEYIFTDNGEFIFEYVDDYGNTGSTKAEVNWIVKTPTEETPDNGTDNETPDNGAGNETPDNGTGNETPDNGTGNETPDNGAGNETPDNGAGNETPDNGAGNETPDNGTGNETPDNGAGNETPDNGTGNETPDNGTGNETPDSGTGNEMPEQPDYIIPDSIKPFIDSTVVSVSGGNGTQNEPLSLQVLDSVDVDTLTTMIESFGVYRLTFERKEQQDQPSMITYVVTIQNESETYHLTMTVAKAQNEIIHYLDSLIEDQAVSDDQPSTDQNESSTTNPSNKPETGMTLSLPLIFGGMMTTLSGIVATYKNRRK